MLKSFWGGGGGELGRGVFDNQMIKTFFLRSQRTRHPRHESHIKEKIIILKNDSTKMVRPFFVRAQKFILIWLMFNPFFNSDLLRGILVKTSLSIGCQCYWKNYKLMTSNCNMKYHYYLDWWFIITGNTSVLC